MLSREIFAILSELFHMLSPTQLTADAFKSRCNLEVMPFAEQTFVSS